jgi:hypothetical protein
MSFKQLDLLTERNNRVRVTFDKDYENANPRPNSDDTLTVYGIYAGLGGALILSGLFTIPAFMIVLSVTGMQMGFQVVGGVAGFIAIDVFLVIAAGAVIRMDWKFNTQKEKTFSNISKVRAIMNGAAIFGFVVSVSSNLYFVIIGYEVIAQESLVFKGVSLAVGLLLAFSPAVQSVATGSLFALMPLTDEIAGIEWRNEREAYWKRVRKQHYGYQDLSDAIERLSAETDFMNVHEIHETPEKPKKLSPKRLLVHEYLNEHSSSLTMPILEFANVVGVSNGLASEERNNWIRQQ